MPEVASRRPSGLRSQAGLIRRPARCPTPRADLDEVAASADLVRVYLNEIGKVALLTAADEVELAKRIEAGLYASAPARVANNSFTAARKRDLRPWSWSTASAPRITCCARTCAWWSRWPSATPGTACRSST